MTGRPPGTESHTPGVPPVADVRARRLPEPPRMPVRSVRPPVGGRTRTWMTAPTRCTASRGKVVARLIPCVDPCVWWRPVFLREGSTVPDRSPVPAATPEPTPVDAARARAPRRPETHTRSRRPCSDRDGWRGGRALQVPPHCRSPVRVICGAPTVTWHAWPPGTAAAGALGGPKTSGGGRGCPGDQPEAVRQPRIGLGTVPPPSTRAAREATAP